ncbi:MAG: FMN-binding protein [Clostridia bacterium]|nr:FMN-binding protein [Clostridia bacterium]
MKKFLSLLLVLCLMVPAFALAESAPALKIGQVLCSPNGEQSFAVVTVVLEGDVIVAAYIDEFQFMAAEGNIAVPSSEGQFGQNYPEGQVLGSKRVNNETYSAMMTAYAGSTVSIADNYDAIQAYVIGKTVADLEAELAAKTAEEMVDAVSGATLVATPGYLQGIIDAAKAAK